MPRGRKPIRTYPQSLGGQRLRVLRERANLSLVDLEAETDYKIGTAHLQKIESGAIKRPDPETLDIILTALHTNYRDRRAVLEAFGYTMPMTLPTSDEIDKAVQLSAYELGDATHPILLVDLGQRLWAWNRYIPRMIGLDSHDPATHSFVGVTLLDVTLNPAFGTSRLIANPDEFLPPVIHYIKASLYPFREEVWCQELIARARNFPGFSVMWDSFPDKALERFVSQRIIPLNVQIAGFGVLQFRMSTVEFEYDPRFHIIHFTPFGAMTLRASAVWAEAEGML